MSPKRCMRNMEMAMALERTPAGEWLVKTDKGDVAPGVRTYAITTEPDVCRRAEEQELVGAGVRLRSTVVEGPFGPASVNRATPRE